jgi:hypothetical protein
VSFCLEPPEAGPGVAKLQDVRTLTHRLQAAAGVADDRHRRRQGQARPGAQLRGETPLVGELAEA